MPNESSVKKGNGGIWIGLVSGGLALIGGIGCCGLPIIGGTLVIFGAGSGLISTLKPWQPFFIVLAVIALAYEFYKAYRPLSDKSACCVNRRGKRLMLWSTTILMTILTTVQYTSGLNPETNEKNGVPFSTSVAVDKPDENASSCSPTGCDTKFKISNGFIKTPLREGQHLDLTVLNLEGSVLGTQRITYGDYIDLTNYDDGKYILRFETPTGNITQPMILRKDKCCTMKTP